jgi:hypothetical protein
LNLQMALCTDLLFILAIHSYFTTISTLISIVL